MGKVRQGIETRERFADALLQLLETRDPSSIRIRELAECAGVDRQTFYHHFDDIYELADFTYDREIARLFSMDNVDDTFSVPQTYHIRNILRGIEDSSTGLRHLLVFIHARNPQSHFYDLVRRNMASVRARLFAAGYQEGRIALAEDMISTAVVSVIMSWVHGRLPLSADQLAARLFHGVDALTDGLVGNPGL